MSILEGSSILITGGTGSFGKAFVTRLLNDINPRRVVIYSRDELKQYECRQMFNDDPRLRWFLGDIRDLLRNQAAANAGPAGGTPGQGGYTDPNEPPRH